MKPKKVLPMDRTEGSLVDVLEHVGGGLHADDVVRRPARSKKGLTAPTSPELRNSRAGQHRKRR
jgi:hypothetical protein